MMDTIKEIKLKALPTNILNIYNKKVVTADEAVGHIKSGDNIVVQPGCAAPMELIKAMVNRKDELENVSLYHILIVGYLPYTKPGIEKHFQDHPFC